MSVTAGVDQPDYASPMDRERVCHPVKSCLLRDVTPFVILSRPALCDILISHLVKPCLVRDSQN